MLYKLAASRLDKEIDKAIKSKDYNKALSMIKTVYGDEAAKKHVLELESTIGNNFKRALLASSEIPLKNNKSLRDDILSNYKPVMRKLYKMKNFNARKPYDQLSEDERFLILRNYKKARKNIPEKRLNYALKHGIDPEKEVYISHGGTKEHLEGFLKRGRGAVRDSNGYNITKGIWTHVSDYEPGWASGGERWYAEHASNRTGGTPFRLIGKIKAKYLKQVPKDYEAMLPVEHRDKVKIVSLHPLRTDNVKEAVKHYRRKEVLSLSKALRKISPEKYSTNSGLANKIQQVSGKWLSRLKR